MMWKYFTLFAILSAGFSLLASVLAWLRKPRKSVLTFSAIGAGIFAVFILLFWLDVKRPPFATLGETRLWYVFFLFLAGMLSYASLSYRWLPTLTTLLAGVFMAMNVLFPDIHTQNLMPVLQSVWFSPHVISYIFAYALLGIGFLLSVYALFTRNRTKRGELIRSIDRLTHIGTGFLLTGICLGALWAKQAWGYFWAWDPKETWALITLLCYALYIGLREASRTDLPALSVKIPICLQIAGFVCLQVCWYGVNYLNAARGLSVHIYG